MAVVLTLVQTKQIRIHTHIRNNKKNTVQTIQNTYKYKIKKYKTVNTSTHITKTPTHYKTHTPTHYKTHTSQNPHIHTHTHTHYKTS